VANDSYIHSQSSEYFAALKGEAFGKECMARVDEHFRHLRAEGYYTQFLKSELAYYGQSTTNNGARSDSVGRTGEHNEYALLKVNHYRNLAQHTLTLCTSQRPAPQPIASNSDSKTQQQVTLAHGLLDYYSREKRVERSLKRAAEMGIIYSEGYIEMEWDTALGEEYGVRDNPDGSQTSVREGDIRLHNLSPLDVIRDPFRDPHQHQEWCITRHFENRFELMAKYPEWAELIAGLPGAQYDSANFRPTWRNTTYRYSDDIACYRFYHESTAAVPGGRMTTLLDGNIILTDGGLPYRRIPVRRIAPADHMGTSFGYSPMFDLIGIQEAVDALYSVVLTNQTTFGVQTIVIPKGHGLTYSQIAKGLALLEVNSLEHKPEALNLTLTPQEVFSFIRQLEDVMETLSGINSTVRGNPEASLKSGSALALVQSQAIQFSSGLQQSYAQLVEDVFTDMLNILKDFAKSERVVAIVGKHNQYQLREFTGDDLSLISRVVVDSGSALSKTPSGRIQIAQDLLAAKLVTTPEQYLAVVNTGQLTPMTEGDNSELILMQSENEALANGQEVPVLAIDRHSLHIREHRALAANLAARSNPGMMRVLLSHISRHIEQLKTADPALLQQIGEQSMAVPPMPPEQAAGGTPPKDGAVPQLPQLTAPVPEPDYPINPSTGTQWDPITGGGAIVTDVPGGM
jgi:hypothetical protein